MGLLPALSSGLYLYILIISAKQVLIYILSMFLCHLQHLFYIIPQNKPIAKNKKSLIFICGGGIIYLPHKNLIGNSRKEWHFYFGKNAYFYFGISCVSVKSFCVVAKRSCIFRCVTSVAHTFLFLGG